VSISEFVQHGKPSLLVPIQAQTEQIGNADKARRLGISLDEDETQLEPEVVRDRLETLCSGGYSARAERLGDVSRRFDAVASIRRELASKPT
jgi:UDP-N-acetylglucosamine:LPS N-acetylglucosamine transferase